MITVRDTLVAADGGLLSGLVDVSGAVEELRNFCDARKEQKRRWNVMESELKDMADKRQALDTQLGLLQAQQASNQAEIERMRKERMDAEETFRKDKAAMQESYATAMAKVEERMRFASEKEQKELETNLEALQSDMQSKLQEQDASAAKEKAVMEGMIKRYEEQLKAKDEEEKKIKEKLELESKKLQEVEEEKRRKEQEQRKKDAAAAALAEAMTKKDISALEGAIRDAKGCGVETSRAETELSRLKDEAKAKGNGSEARAAARAALGAQERSKLDKELFEECDYGRSKGDRGKVQGMLDRGADPNGYKVRRKQAVHSTACLLRSFSCFFRILWCRSLFFSVRFSFVCSLDD